MSWLLKLLWFRLSFGCLFPLHMSSPAGESEGDSAMGEATGASAGYDGGEQGPAGTNPGDQAMAEATGYSEGYGGESEGGGWGPEGLGLSGPGIGGLGFGGGLDPIAAQPGYEAHQNLQALEAYYGYDKTTQLGEMFGYDAEGKLDQSGYYDEVFDDYTGFSKGLTQENIENFVNWENKGPVEKAFTAAGKLLGFSPQGALTSEAISYGAFLAGVGPGMGQVVSGAYDLYSWANELGTTYEALGFETPGYAVQDYYGGYNESVAQGQAKGGPITQEERRANAAAEWQKLEEERTAGVTQGKADLESYLEGYEGYEGYKETMESMKVRGTWNPGAADAIMAEMGKFETQRDTAKAAIEENQFVRLGDLQKRGESRVAEKKKAPTSTTKGAVRGQLGQVSPNLGRSNFRQPTLLSGAS